MQQLVIKIQLPAIFSVESEVDLELIGYKFDPIGRLGQLQESNNLYNEQNVGDILKTLLE
jgi:hypothetical protein